MCHDSLPVRLGAVSRRGGCHILETKGEIYRLQDAKHRRKPTA